MDINKIFSVLSKLDKYPIEIIFAKQLWLIGIDSEERMVEELKKYPALSGVIKNKLQNATRDIERGFYKLNDIPTLFK